MPDQNKITAYPTKTDLLRLARDVLDQRPQAIRLVKDVAHQFQLPTLTAVIQLANAYLQQQKPPDAKP